MIRGAIFWSTGSDCKALPVAANAVVILTHAPEWHGIIAYDAFREAVITTAAPPWDAVDAPATLAPGEWSDSDTVRATNWLARHTRINFNVTAVEQAISVVAAHAVVHPVRDYLNGLAWDRTARIDCLFVDYFGAENTTYACGVGARFMIRRSRPCGVARRQG